jgi:predicted porin
MKKTIIAAAIAASVAAPAAFAEVSIYGKAHLALEQSDASADGSTVMNDNIDSNASRFGIKVSEDLGNGLSSFVKFEFGADAIDGDNGLTARDAVAGLKGDFGTLTVGRMASPAKAVLYGTGNVQLADANNGNDFAGGFVSKGTRVSNAVAYGTKVGGVGLTVATVGDDAGDNFAHNAFAVSTDVAGAHIALAKVNYDGAADLTILGAKMSMDALTVGVVYEDEDATNSTTGISLSYAMGNNVVSASTSTREFDAAGTADTDRVAFGIEHKLSKKTSVYASYADVDTGTAASSGDVTSVGMIVNF